MNWTIVLMAVLFNLVETAYYGWNWTAHSDAEMICDGISLLIFSLALVKA